MAERATRRRIWLASALCVLATAAPAQERHTNGERGGLVALCSTSFAWSASECQSLLGEHTGPRLVLELTPGGGADPLAAAGSKLERSVLDPAQELAGDAPELRARVESAAVIELLGGTWLEWSKVLAPNSKASGLTQALREAHRRGTPILGTGAAAGHLAIYSIVARAALGRIERNPRRVDPDAFFDGLGLAPVAWDASPEPGASFARLLRALLHSGLDGGVYAQGDVAWIVDPAQMNARVVAHDGGALWLVDASTARRMRNSLRDARLALLEDGQRWSLERREPLEPGPAWTAAGTGERPTQTVDDALALATLAPFLHASAWDKTRSVTLTASTTQVVLASAVDTLRLPGRAAALARLSFTVLWDEPAR